MLVLAEVRVFSWRSEQICCELGTKFENKTRCDDTPKDSISTCPLRPPWKLKSCESPSAHIMNTDRSSMS